MSERAGADVPRCDVVVPGLVRELAGPLPVVPLWRNELGGLTFRAGRRVVKYQPLEGLDGPALADVDLLAEAERLEWARGFVPVPEVVEAGRDSEAMWLVTRVFDGTSAYDARWKADPEAAVHAIATGLRMLHDSAPVESCPFIGSWPGDIVVPEPDRLVVCHGDACVPNTLMAADGRFAGLVDLGRLGVADRWADLAIATYSISWDANFGRSYDDLFFETYDVEPDEERIRFYRELWDS